MGTPIDLDVLEHLMWCRDIRGLSRETIRIRRGVLERASDTMGVRLRDAHAGHLQRWQELTLPGKAPESRRCYIGHMAAFYRWALKRGLVGEDPTTLLDRPRVPKGLPHPISEEDLARAIRAARPKLAAMIVLTAFAGLRCMEVAGLLWSDLRQTQAGWAILVRGKGRRERIVPVGLVVIQALRAHGWQRRGPVFLGHNGGQITPNAVSWVVNSHYRRLGIQATAHYGRHRYITVGVEDVGDVVLMQHLAGHESLSTTQIYAAYSTVKAARLVELLDERAARMLGRAGPVGLQRPTPPQDADRPGPGVVDWPPWAS